MSGKRSFGYAVAALVAVSLVARVSVVLATPHFRAASDSADYDQIALSLAEHGTFSPSHLVPARGPSAFRPPLFPIALAAVYEVVGTGSRADRWEAGRLFEAALGAVAVLLICAISLRLWGRRAALLSGAIAALYPPLVLVGSSLMTEPLFITLVLAAVLSALVARDSPHSGRWQTLAGVLVGLGALTRANGIVLLIPIAFLVWNGERRLSWLSIRGPLIAIAATLVTLAPWTIRNESVFHQLVPITTENGYALAGTYNGGTDHDPVYPALWRYPIAQEEKVLAHDPRLNEAQVSSKLASVALDYVKHHPTYPLKVAYWNALRLLNLTGTRLEEDVARDVGYPVWLASLSVYAFWVLAPIALAGLIVTAARRAPWAFWACPLLLFASNLLFIGATRYRSPADPFLVIAAALGVQAGVCATAAMRSRKSGAQIRPASPTRDATASSGAPARATSGPLRRS